MPHTGDPSTDYWTNGTVFGGLSGHRFSGPHGLEQLSGMMRLGAAQPSAFAATLSRIQFDHAALQAFDATAHHAERSAADISADPTALVTVGLLLQGELTVSIADRTFRATAGDVLVLGSDTPVRYACTARVRTLQCVTGAEHLPRSVLGPGVSFPHVVARTPLTESLFRFAGRLLEGAAEPTGLQNPRLVSALVSLQCAVLVEAQRASGRSGAGDLRQQIEEYIDLHLADPALTPPVIAEAMGISLRQAHLVFSRDECTLAREIRNRRLDAIALELRSNARSANARSLAARYGFGSPDALGRLFRQRFGMSLRDYTSQDPPA